MVQLGLKPRHPTCQGRHCCCHCPDQIPTPSPIFASSTPLPYRHPEPSFGCSPRPTVPPHGCSLQSGVLPGPHLPATSQGRLQTSHGKEMNSSCTSTRCPASLVTGEKRGLKPRAGPAVSLLPFRWTKIKQIGEPGTGGLPPTRAHWTLELWTCFCRPQPDLGAGQAPVSVWTCRQHLLHTEARGLQRH